MTRIQKRFKNDIYYVDNAGEVIEKVCRSCMTLKPSDSFIKGGGVAKLHNECISCEKVALINEALNTSNYSGKIAEVLAELYESDPTISHKPKYDWKGRRRLVCREPEDFRRIALADGWKAARDKYDVNHFFYSLLRRDYFTEDDIEHINAKTKPVSRNVSATKYFQLSLESTRHAIADDYYTWLRDVEGRLYLIKGSDIHNYSPGEIVEFNAKVKGNYQIEGEKYTQLWYVVNKSLNLVKSPHRHVWTKV